MRNGLGFLVAAVMLGYAPLSVEAQPFSFTQITSTTSPAGNVNPSIDALGTRISFLSASDLTPGNPGNPIGERQLFLFDTTTGRLTQLTNIHGPDSLPVVQQAINASGTKIAFVSNGNPTPGNPGNADANHEIFLVDIATGAFTQITNTAGGGGVGGVANAGPLLNAAGTRIVFSSDRDLTPGNPGNADGNFELFLYDTTTGLFTQLTNTAPPANNQTASINAGNAAGTRIVFVSDADLTPGHPGNADGNPEIFLLDTTTGLFTQITNTTGPGINTSPAINAAGTRIAFISTRDLAPGSPGNADGNAELFLFDITTGAFTQVTNTTGSGGGVPNQGPSINASGSRIAFFSNRDLTPGNPGNADANFEIFLAIGLAAPQPIPTLSEWVQIVLGALLLASGLAALRRGPARSPQRRP